jgi:cytochrome c1
VKARCSVRAVPLLACAAAWAAPPPPEPVPPLPPAQAGQAAFHTRCGLCHAVRGTAARGILGPDLTHLMSRSRIAADLLPNNAGNLGGWVADAQTLKPGCFMPTLELSGPELQAILAYLQTLR